MTTPFSEFYQSLDDDALKRGKQFEHFVKWFLQTDPEWATQVDQVWLWEEWPQRWGADCGIDLVFRHKNGEHWAVQAKCYSPDYDITKHDVDKFLSESNRSLIQHRLLIASTDGIGANAKQVCDAQDKPVIRYLLSDFERALVDYPANMAALPQAKRKARPAPREHQVEAITTVVQSLASAERGQLIMACGTGKTYVTLWLKEALNAQRTLVLVPSLGLLSQLLREWTFAASAPFEVLCVCSDQTVGSKSNDEAVHSVADLAFPVTSDAEEVKRFLRGTGNRVVFSTYQSSSVIVAAQTDSDIADFDLAVADEAHRCAGKVGSDFTAILDGAQIRSRKRLFATATPRTYSSTVKKSAEERGVEVVGMDDVAQFGEVLYALPFGKAIENKLLTDYRVVIIGVDDPTIAQWIARRELVSLSPLPPLGEGWDEGGQDEFYQKLKQPSSIRQTDSESLAAQIGLLKAIKDYDLKRVISFHSRVKRAEEFTSDMQNTMQWVADEHRPSGTLHTDYVSGDMSAGKRKIKLDQLKALNTNERGVLSNARCLSEGVDVPSLDGVAFIDPRSSQVDIIQAVGRAIRLSADKKIGTIVLPVFIKAGEDAVSTIEASNFKPVWEVLNALKAHDDVLACELDNFRTEMGRKSDSSFNASDFNKIAIDLPVTVDANFSSALRTYLVERVTTSWNFFFGLLESYEKRVGHCFAPQFFETSDGFRLGQWVAVQRATKNNLSQERKARLEALPSWSWYPLDFKWEAKFAELLAYKAAYGHVNVLTDPSDKLWVWVRTQRQSGVQGLLSEDRLKRLVDVGFDWDPRASNWEEMFNELLAYKAQYGDVNVPDEWMTPLGTWVGKQRSAKKSGKLSADRELRLVNVGFIWDSNESIWDTRYSELRAYKELHGDINLPHDRTSELWRWVSTQRIFKKRGKLPADKIQRLNEIGFVWDVAETQWAENFNKLIEYKSEHGHVNVRTQPPTPLGAWVNGQRVQYRKRKLSVEQIEKMNAIGFIWEPFDVLWESKFAELLAYKLEHENMNVSRSESDKLTTWIDRQRDLKKRGGFCQID